MVHAKKEDKVLEIRKDPSRIELAWFGAIFLAVFSVLGLVFWGKGRFIFGTGGAPPIASIVAWAIGASVFLVYYAIPPLRKKIYVGFMYVVYPIGFVMSHVILGAVYFLLFTPIGFIMRAFGYNPLGRRYLPDASTYWVEHRTGDDAPRYLRQF
jgi:ABC-type uncharacterized transport system permease subunit